MTHAPLRLVPAPRPDFTIDRYPVGPAVWKLRVIGAVLVVLLPLAVLALAALVRG